MAMDTFGAATAAAQAECTHKKSNGESACISHTFINGELWVRCARCGQQWSATKPAKAIVLAGNKAQYDNFIKATSGSEKPTKYYDGTGIISGVHADELIFVGSFFSREDAHDILQYAKVALNQSKNPSTYCKLWGAPGWYISSWDNNGDPILRNPDGKLACVSCKKLVNETYKGGKCGQCPNINYSPGAQKMAFKGKKVGGSGITKQEYDAYGFGPGVKTVAKPKVVPIVRKQGDIWKLPLANAPFRSQQWAYQGSAKTPYVITHYDDKRDGAVTSEGWACSCMSFTRNVPRTPCKHILNVMLDEGISSVKKSTAKLANVDDDKLAAFEKWQREEAQRKAKNEKVSGEAKLNLFGNTGRKFR